MKVQYLVNIADVSELPSQAITVFGWSSKKQQSCIIPMEDEAFSVDLFQTLFAE